MKSANQSSAHRIQPATPPRRRRTTPLAWLFAALALLCFAPANAIAQTTFPDTLDLGTESNVRLNLILPKTTADGKTYYYVDVDNSNTFSHGDVLNHDLLDDLFNGGTDTTVTQEGVHDGTDDARSALIGAYTLILPTETELLAFIADPSYGTLPSQARNAATFSWTANLDSAGNHLIVVPSDSSNQPLVDTAATPSVLFFQVLPAPAGPNFGATTIPNQNFSLARTVTFTLPAASGGIGTLSYSLDGTLPAAAGRSYNATTRVLTANPLAVVSSAPLTYTVTDTRPATATAVTASLTFTFTALAVSITGTGGGRVVYADGAVAVDNIGGLGTNNDNANTENNENSMRLILPAIHPVTAVTVTTYDPSTGTAAPDGVTFSNKAMDIALTGSLTTGTTATVCLSPPMSRLRAQRSTTCLLPPPMLPGSGKKPTPLPAQSPASSVATPPYSHHSWSAIRRLPLPA